MYIFLNFLIPQTLKTINIIKNTKLPIKDSFIKSKLTSKNNKLTINISPIKPPPGIPDITTPLNIATKSLSNTY